MYGEKRIFCRSCLNTGLYQSHKSPTMSERLIPHKSLLYLFPFSQKAFLFSALTFQTSALQRDRLNVRQGDFTFISYFSIRSLCFHSPFFYYSSSPSCYMRPAVTKMAVPPSGLQEMYCRNKTGFRTSNKWCVACDL